MKLTHTYLTAAAVAGLVLTSVGGSVVAQADPLPYGPDTCIQGYVWREARPGDTVCVTPAVRDAVAFQNANPGSNRDPNAGSGPLSCSQGYVWREAFDGDTICVTPDVRSATLADNAAAPSRYQRNAPVPTAEAASAETVILEITGTGTVYSINTDPDVGSAGEDTPVPFKRTFPLDPDTDLLQIIAVTKTGEQGCRITIGGFVGVEHAPGAGSHCIYHP